MILYRGITLSSFITSIAVVIKLVVLVVFISIGLFHIDLSNWTPYIPPNTGVFGQYGLSGIVAGTSMVFLAYNGFDSICTAAQEVKNPKKNIPIGIIMTILVVSIIYILTSAVMTGLVNYTELGVPEAMAIAVEKIGISWLDYFVKFGALIGLSSVILVSQYTIIRMLLIMAEDGLFPNFFVKIHSIFKTPHIITVTIGILMAVIAGMVKLANIALLSGFFILIALTVICYSIIVMRYKHPDLKRKFKCPFMPFTPILAISLTTYILASYPAKIYFAATIILAILLLIYTIYKLYNRACNSA
jgi:APA family basic amino acid/polyamine antiporter